MDFSPQERTRGGKKNGIRLGKPRFVWEPKEAITPSKQKRVRSNHVPSDAQGDGTLARNNRGRWIRELRAARTRRRVKKIKKPAEGSVRGQTINETRENRGDSGEGATSVRRAPQRTPFSALRQ